ncbi:MAG: ATP phosphoribosyltransferase regulatory subunit [Litorivicinus sp.]
MSTSTTWLLPDGIDEAGPKAAADIEYLRRICLDRMQSFGYQMVIPPMVEFVDALLTGVGRDLDLQTLKVTDQLSGRQLGIRADMTPQAARMDARTGQGINRLCYCGSTLKARPSKLGDSRAPIQIGAELFGYEGLGADIELITLLLELTDALGLPMLTLDVGHVDLYRLAISTVPEAKRDAAEQALAQKDASQLAALALDDTANQRLRVLMDTQGGAGCLTGLADAFPEAADALEQCTTLATALDGRVNLHFDFAEGRGAHYHTGLVFALYAPDEAAPLAQGGRYDAAGEAFGTRRAATGFSADLRLWQLHAKLDLATPAPIAAPHLEDPSLTEAIAALRLQGEIVITDFDQNATHTRRLVKAGTQWTIEKTQ